MLAMASLLLGACGGGGGSGGAAGAGGQQTLDVADADVPGVAPPGTYAPGGSADFPNFIYPQPGDPKADTTQPLQWTAAAGARAYEIQIGTSPGASDILDSGIITSTSLAMPALPSGAVIYARVRAILQGWGDDLPAGHWPRGAYTLFRIDGQTPASQFLNLKKGGTLAAGHPVEWTASPLAIGYHLAITGATFDGAASNPGQGGLAGTASGTGGTSNTSVDSGFIHTTHIFIDATASAQVSATLTTVYLNGTETTQLTFTAAGGPPAFADSYALAKTLTAEVRGMADRDNQPYGPTALLTVVSGEGLSSASCQEFMVTLRQILVEVRVGVPVRTLDIALQDNGYDTHTLVEALDQGSSRWVTLDPTFGLVTLRADGVPATSAEISAAVRAQNWSALTYTLLTPAGATYANDYYIDYPLLYMNVTNADGSGLVQAAPATLAPYFDALPLPVSGGKAAYGLKCPSGATSSSAQVDSSVETLPCGGSDGLSGLFWAYDIDATSGGATDAWRVRRFTF
jgi:hypothetical protein